VLCADLHRSVGRDEMQVAAWDGRPSHSKLSGIMMVEGRVGLWAVPCRNGSALLPDSL
jgi:hypothetical protein